MRGSRGSPYERRLQRVLAYVHENLSGDLSLERLSEVAGLSRFHFHRLFSAYTGSTVAEVVRLLRLKRAAHRLAFERGSKVIDVALDAGFSNPETFSRAFKAAYGDTPIGFREAPEWSEAPILRLPPSTTNRTMKPEIKTIPTIPVAVLEHHGPQRTIFSTVTRFIEWRRASSCSPVREARTFGIAYDDPDTSDPTAFRFDVCGELLRPLEPNDFGVVEKAIPGGRHAVVRHHGSTDELGPVVLEMYRKWLPESGEELREFPVFFEYVRRMPEVLEHEQITDIYLPLE